MGWVKWEMVCQWVLGGAFGLATAWCYCSGPVTWMGEREIKENKEEGRGSNRQTDRGFVCYRSGKTIIEVKQQFRFNILKRKSN